ncbi:hypothetical protein H9P43_007135 [Blastocladiella emersonii ATCC 22665]|nr:hypothetical protein H9P43_007135 [Blastocladiella emersonii ATCC 22665]
MTYLTPAELAAIAQALGPTSLGTAPRPATEADVEAIVALTNLAYEDSNWFKQPAFHQRTNPGEIRASLTENTADEIRVVVDWPSPSASIPEPAAGCATSAVGASGRPLACAMSVHRDAFTRQPTLSQLAVHPLLHRRGLAKYMVECAARVGGVAVTRDDPKVPRALLLEVINLQPHLLEIYGKFGFSENGRVRTWDEFGVPTSMFTQPCHLSDREPNDTPVPTTPTAEAEYITSADLSAAISQAGGACSLGTFPRAADPADVAAIVAVTNLAYEDAHWFKVPAIHDRADAAEVSAALANVRDELRIVVDWPALPDLPQPEPGSKTAVLGARGLPLAAALSVHRDAVTGQPTLSQLAVHPLLHRRGLAGYLVEVAVGVARAAASRNPQTKRALLIEVVNIQAHLAGIYEKRGFVRTGATRTWPELGIAPELITKDSHFILLERPL